MNTGGLASDSAPDDSSSGNRAPGATTFSVPVALLDGQYADGTGTDGNDDDKHNPPSFGKSHITNKMLVTCGYKMDDTCRDVYDYHVEYERDIIQTNTTHTFTLKAFVPNLANSFTIAFGVPDVGTPLSNAEASIKVILGIDYSEPSYHYIEDVVIYDPNNIIDYNSTNTMVLSTSCTGGNTMCTQVTFPSVLFRDTTYHEPFAILVVDTLLYTAVNYMNEGILITGDSLNPIPTVSSGITVDVGDKPTNLILERIDKANDLWKDIFGNVWSHNSFGNFVIVQYAPHAGTIPVCDDINDRICAPFKAKLDWHNQNMIQLRDSLYDAYKTKAYAEIDNIFTYEFGDLDSRTQTLINLGWLN